MSYAKQLKKTEAGGYLMSLTTKVKQMALNLTDLEVKVEEATNNEPWGPHGSVMAEISEAAFDSEGYRQIMGVIARRLQDTGDLWRHVYKSLLLLEYMLKHGPQKVVQELSSNVVVIEKLTNFQYKDKNLRDHGENVRHRAKQLTELIMDPERVRSERKKAKELKSKYTGVSSDAMRSRSGGGGGMGGGGPSHRYYDDDDEDDVYASSGRDRGAVGVAKDPMEATRARIEAMKSKKSEEAEEELPAARQGKKLSTMKVDPKVSASLGLKAPTPKPAAPAREVDLMGGLDEETTQKPAAANDTWNAFEDADDSKSAAAATNGDNSWANFESAPAAAPAASSDPVADLFSLDAGAPAAQPTAPTAAADPFGFDTPATPATSTPAPVSPGSVFSKPALPEDMFSEPLAPPPPQTQTQHLYSQQSAPSGAQGGFGATGFATFPPAAATAPAASFAAFGQQPPAPAFGQPPASAPGSFLSAAPPLQPGTPGRQSSTNPDGTVDVRSLGLTSQEQVHSTRGDPFAGLGF